MPTLTTSIQHSTGNFSQEKSDNKRNKYLQTGNKEVKLSPFKDGMMLYVETLRNPQKAIIRADHHIQQACRVFKISIQNPSVFLHTSNEPPPQSEIKAIISFTITLKHLGINSIKKQRLAC